MKISKAYFNRFKKAFLYWQKEFGLTQYDIAFYQTYLKTAYAEIHVNEMAKTADVYLTDELEGDRMKADDGPESNGKHEAVHLLLYRLVWLGKARCLNPTDIDEEWEALTRRLEKVLK